MKRRVLNRTKGGPPRSERVNELYYARNNAPTYNQFGRKYHFIDDIGRQYMIASRNNQVFQNTNFIISSSSSSSSSSSQPLHCIMTSLGYIKLFVKLPRGEVEKKWFKDTDIGKTLILKYKREKGVLTSNIDNLLYEVKLKSTEKTSAKRATGFIFVKGLDFDLCNDLLNKQKAY